MSFLMIDGQGDPNTSQDYADSIGALYTVAYTLKFDIKKADSSADYSVMPLEGLWWSADHSHFATGERGQWQWTMMIVQPPVVTAQAVDAAMQGEIYLGDPRRTEPAKLKTVIRQPIARRGKRRTTDLTYDRFDVRQA